ncbi:3-oxoacyl-[acyl-carrier-protein] reductase [Caldicellulosiruptor bescii]|uniref:3-oxoacyl-[acyl-carrier-protein] reductase n=2 Tax=Caldicellulosiruptor bescii TaxID=31899 RepID=B9MRF3_CALBD|nr:3-oxoacyl-[acyl-carrier-protein] reductase [Caldicellulosiruptor bescii]ACM60257.1 3-oxoacyl-(acyl-carrier-protein) reductase [Caldicellulosiruptor bescii DSM 6725]PBC87672.1 3-oxoacyl-[acyl-carrier-protein] reductase [Caldicellulosiruptor bescii]PBC90605.1 3-oxoacyl-[acyl-carrier-protein] reductase [Caldicellulosiruptor bescii]PBD03963.1 3-oxoacyl-[acyl-carrier-protein] reductase [Caldicellulosiruptor bescii]PBD06402.1 3-oxoacyl-[acyl-carrier-protein] reductase [Caldicellulosiruptor bescii
MELLKDKVALITGASRGIGRAIALKFAQNGANVVINYSSSQSQAENLKEEIEKIGTKTMIIKCDVSNPDEVNQMFSQVENEFGRLDILVNNAGITKDGLILRINEEDFDKVISINLKGAFLCARAAAKMMVKQRFGNIINISSVVGIAGNVGQANYAASKAGIIGLTKSLAKELASRNIRVNAIAPGFIKTDMTEVLSDKVKEAMLSSIPLGRFGEADEIANVALFLASSLSSYITGQVIVVDGGMIM